MQLAEDEKLEEILERKRMEGSSLQAEVMQKVPELVVHELMSQGKKMRGIKGKKKVIGWSTEEMKDKANNLLEEDTKEMRKWSGMSQEEMDQCWKNLAERMGRSSGQVQGRGQQKKGSQRQRRAAGVEACA